MEQVFKKNMLFYGDSKWIGKCGLVIYSLLMKMYPYSSGCNDFVEGEALLS
jgi:hypothetical protein